MKTFYDHIKEVMNKKEDFDIIFKFNRRTDSFIAILSFVNEPGFERFDLPLDNTKEANNE